MSFVTGDSFDRSTAEIEARMGEQVRALRISRGLDQTELAEFAGLSSGAVKNLEQGKGSSLRTIVRIVRALGREDWLFTLAPRVSISPIDVLRGQDAPRRRVYRSR